MRGLKNSIKKRWHALTVSPAAAADTWRDQYWQEGDEFRMIPCRKCPKFDVQQQFCRVRYGTPLRKCAVAGIEAHLHKLNGKSALEIGFGRNALARRLIRRSGGTWTGIEPRLPRGAQPLIGKGNHGHAANIPFPDATFDLVFGIQSIEHWGQKVSSLGKPSDYAVCLAEIHRVLKPGGSIYFDAPIHFHGHEMFIMGDIPRIKKLFQPDLWRNLTLEQWRKHHEPLNAYPPSAKVVEEWPVEVSSYDEAEVGFIRSNSSVWLLTICAEKKFPAVD